jgi:hypothetical protein
MGDENISGGDEMSIQQMLQILANNGEEIYSKVCKVKAVNGLVCDCTPIDGDADIFDVRMIAHDSTKFFVMIPKVDSYVVVNFLNKQAAFISMVSEITEIKFKIGTTYYSADDTGFLIKKDNDTMKEMIQLMLETHQLTIEAVQQIVVLYGNNPDYSKLVQGLTKKGQALTKMNNLLR